MDIRIACQRSLTPPKPALTDPRRINRALFGAYYEEDIYDKFCQRLPLAMRAFAFRIDPAVRDRNLIFVHVPRVAGTSITQTLYGPRCTRHHSMRYFRALDPAFAARVPSFALLRDPFDRFASSYAFVRSRGTESCRLADVFVAETAHIATVDDYLSYLELRDDLSLDFVMRRQSWFVTDLRTGAPLVKDLFLYGEDDAALAAYLRPHGVTELPHLNQSNRSPLFLNADQRRRIERIYAADFALIARVREQRRKRLRPGAVRTAAE
jgi:hypothetical protein